MNQRAGFSFANILKEIIGHFNSLRNNTRGGKNKPLPASVNTRSKKNWISIIAFHLTSTKLYYLWEELFVNFLEHRYLCIHLLLRSISYLINTALIPLCLSLHDAPCLDLKTVMVLFKYRLCWKQFPGSTFTEIQRQEKLLHTIRTLCHLWMQRRVGFRKRLQCSFTDHHEQHPNDDLERFRLWVTVYKSLLMCCFKF